MKNLLYKEWKLALHPTVPLFWLLSAMVLIPNYPYYVIFFYTALGLFFICLTGRENSDLYYTLTLPVAKASLVKARMLFAVIIELIQTACIVPFLILRNALHFPINLVGMDGNIAFLGFGLLLLGIYNAVFFPQYYRTPDKVGKVFAISSIVMAVVMLIMEICAHAVPFIRQRLDTPDPQFAGEKLAALAIGLALYALLTGRAMRKSVRIFERQDL